MKDKGVRINELYKIRKLLLSVENNKKPSRVILTHGKYYKKFQDIEIELFPLNVNFSFALTILGICLKYL